MLKTGDMNGFVTPVGYVVQSYFSSVPNVIKNHICAVFYFRLYLPF